MEWKKGRRGGGNVEDRRGDRRVEALLARNPTFMREVGPRDIMPDRRYGDSGVSNYPRDRPELRFKAGGFVGDGCATRGKTKGKNR